MKSINKVSDLVSVLDSVIYRDSVSVSVETKNHGFGRSLAEHVSEVVLEDSRVTLGLLINV